LKRGQFGKTYAIRVAGLREIGPVTLDQIGQVALGSVGVTGASAPSLSRDGTMLAVSSTPPQTGTDLWLYDVKRDTPMRLTFDSAGSGPGSGLPTAKTWSLLPAGALAPALARLYRRPTTGSGSDELPSKIDGATPSDWSSDGRFILFHSNNNLRDLRFPFPKRYDVTSDGQRLVVQE
jgi:hypothetical protein